MGKRYSLKQTKTTVVEKTQAETLPVKSRKGIIICLSLLCLLFLGGGIYLYQIMNTKITQLNYSLASSQSSYVELSKELDKVKLELKKVEEDSANYKRLKDYYAPFEKKYNILYDRLSESEKKALEKALSGESEPIDYTEQLKKYGEKQKSSDADYGLYLQKNSDGTVSVSDRVMDKVIENRKKGINPSN